MKRIPAFIVLCVMLLALTSANAQSNSLEQRLERAAALIRNNSLPEAEELLNGILKATAKEPRALSLLGTIRGSQGKLEEAESLFLRAIAIDGASVPARMNLAYVYLLKGDPNKTISALREVLKLEPDYQEAREKLARLLLGQGKVDECISFIENAKPVGSIALLVTLGDAYFRKGDPKNAEGNYLLALGQRPDAAEALLGLAQCAQVSSDAKTASLYLSRAKSFLAGSPDLLYRFALIALESDMMDDARAALEQAAKLRRAEPAYLLTLGNLWLKKSDLFEAEQAFRRALELQPGSAQGEMYLGYALLKQKRFAEAREWLEKSLQREANIPETFYYLGLIAQEQERETQAVEYFQKAIQLSPSFAHPHIALGSTYLKLKDYQRAQQELETGVKLKPDDSKAHYNLALLYARLKNPERAQKEMQILESLKNSNQRTKESDALLPPPPRPH